LETEYPVGGLDNMSTSFVDWSKEKLSHCKTDWERVEYWFSGMGMVYKENGEWKGKVTVGEIRGRIDDSFPSAEAAMRCVERVWKREEEKRNKNCQPIEGKASWLTKKIQEGREWG
jgi:hypothetical protein